MTVLLEYTNLFPARNSAISKIFYVLYWHFPNAIDTYNAQNYTRAIDGPLLQGPLC